MKIIHISISINYLAIIVNTVPYHEIYTYFLQLVSRGSFAVGSKVPKRSFYTLNKLYNTKNITLTTCLGIHTRTLRIG